MLTAFRLPLLSLATASLLTFGCHAQAPEAITPGKSLPAATAFRVEALLRRKADLPPASTIHIDPVADSKVPGFKSLTITFSSEGRNSRPLSFLISDDGKSLEQVTSFDIAADPRAIVTAEGRPFRGGPATAPVTIVGFDDLECPFCARLHQAIFPAIQNRYGDKVHIVYRDFPLDIHPWAEHAAIDVECLATQSPTAYWNAVDTIHAQHDVIGGDPKDPKADKTMDRSIQQLDAIAREKGTEQKVDMNALNACLGKQDTRQVEESKKLAEALSLQSAPTLFINGDKIEGSVPIEFIFGIIDEALLAQGATPPPPYTPPMPEPAKTGPAPSGK